jgi:hypothetical protein
LNAVEAAPDFGVPGAVPRAPSSAAFGMPEGIVADARPSAVKSRLASNLPVRSSAAPTLA